MDDATPNRPARKSKKRSSKASNEDACPNGRGTSDHGGGEPEETGTSEIGERRQGPTEDTYTIVNARAVLNAIGLEFNELSEVNVNDAWKQYRKRLMENFGILAEVMSAKDITELCMKIGENISGKSADSGGMTPLDETRNFLGTKPRVQ